MSRRDRKDRAFAYDGDDYMEGGELYSFRSEEDRERDRLGSSGKGEKGKEKLEYDEDEEEDDDQDEEEEDDGNEEEDDEEDEDDDEEEGEEEEDGDNSSEEDEDSDDEEDVTKKAIKTMKDVSFADILALRRRGDTDDSDPTHRNHKEAKVKIEKRGKHSSKPPEFSSKAPVSLKRLTSSEGQRFKPRDPRFEETSGSYNQGLFDKAYGFLNEYRESEVTTLKESLKKERDPDERERIETALRHLQQQMANKKRDDIERKRRSEWRKKEQAAVAKGKKPFYLSKVGEKRLALTEKFESLKKSNQLQSYIAKRTKRQAQKSHKQLPRSRRVVDAAPFTVPTKKKRNNFKQQ